MKKDIMLSGVGGQGILSIATVIGWAALDQNLYLKQAEVHGMSQRGGDVQSNLRIASSEIYSDLIPKGECDMIISMEPMEALRYLPWLSPKGWIITSSVPFVNIPNYPQIEEIEKELKKSANLIKIDSEAIAKEIQAPRSSNMVLLGAAARFIEIIKKENLQDGIKNVFMRKGEEMVATNLKAFEAGYEFAQKSL
ncbi:MAG: indolepyruvate oxidoreductase subunit beta [Bacteroidales bacterium]|nr:indolepyruvate oxidoreductase subunit beta [Bacteroidales bacterium]